MLFSSNWRIRVNTSTSMSPPPQLNLTSPPPWMMAFDCSPHQPFIRRLDPSAARDWRHVRSQSMKDHQSHVTANDGRIIWIRCVVRWPQPTFEWTWPIRVHLFRLGRFHRCRNDGIASRNGRHLGDDCSAVRSQNDTQTSGRVWSARQMNADVSLRRLNGRTKVRNL